MDTAVQEGIVKCVNIIHDAPEFDIFYIEIVKDKTTKSHLWIWEELVVNTEDIIIKNCLWCGRVL